MPEQPVYFKSYAGIGSRRTPSDVLDFMAEVANCLAHKHFVLRSGGAAGADQAFLSGAISREMHGGHTVETYLPWDTYEKDALSQITGGHDGHIARWDPARWTFPIAQHHHPNWGALKQGGQKLQARNVHQILGYQEHLRDGQIVFDRSKFVICWTPDGAVTADETSPATGGTGQAIRIADAYGVEVFNLKRSDHRQRVEAMLLDFYEDKED